MFSYSKDKFYELYTSLQEDVKIEDYVEPKKYLGMELDRRPDGSIHLRQPYLTQIIRNMIPGMNRSSSKPTPAVKSPPENK